MPPIIAAPATKWSQSAIKFVISSTSQQSPSTSVYDGWSSYDRATGPYLEKLSMPTTS